MSGYTFKSPEKINHSAKVMAYLKAHPGEWFTVKQIEDATGVSAKIIYSTMYTYGCVGLIGKELSGKHLGFAQRYRYQTRAQQTRVA